MPDTNPPVSADGSINRSHHDVFISYAQLDKPIADAICAKLEARKIRCWIAPRDVPPSREFPAAIVEAIEEAQILVLIFSSHANNSPHVIRELTAGVNKGRIIIPFRVEDVPPSKSMEYLISVPHWLDAISPPLEEHMDELTETIGHILANRRERFCPACNTHLSPHAKFCNACGTRVLPENAVPSSDNKPSPPPPQPVPAAAGSSEGRKETETAPLAPAEEPGPPPLSGTAGTMMPESLPASITVPPDQLEEAVSVAADLSSVPEEPDARRAGASPRIIMGAALAVIAVIVVLVLVVPGLLPSLREEGTSLGGFLSSPQNAAVTTAPVDYRGEVAPVNLVTLTVQPTLTLPRGTELYVEADKDATNVIVTVQFNGGGGMGLVQDNSVILERSDGTVATGKLDFNERQTSIDLQGTRGTDRLRVIVTMKSGTTYTILDKLMPYRFFHSP